MVCSPPSESRFSVRRVVQAEGGRGRWRGTFHSVRHFFGTERISCRACVVSACRCVYFCEEYTFWCTLLIFVLMTIVSRLILNT